MLKPDPQIMKLIKFKESQGKLIQTEPRDLSMEEYNTDPTPLYELTNDDYFSDPPIMEMFTKLYANYNPTKILKETEELPFFSFDPRLQKLSEFDTNYTNYEMEQAKIIDSRYIISRFCPPKFKSLMEMVLKKLPIYGITLPLEESEQYFELSAALDKQIYIFFFGEGGFFTDYERSQYRRAILTQVCDETYIDNREIPFVTEAEDNFLSGMINWPGSDDHEYRTVYRPYFREYIIEKEYWLLPPKKLIGKIARKL